MLVKTGTGMADSSGAGSSPPAREPSRLPRDAQLVISLLHQMGIQDWEPRVINQLLEYTFRYVSEVGHDAEMYKRHAGKQQLDADDIRVAIKLKDTQIMRPPDRDELIALAAERNREPLPSVTSQQEHGIRLPPPEQTLTGINYQIANKRPMTGQQGGGGQRQRTRPQ